MRVLLLGLPKPLMPSPTKANRSDPGPGGEQQQKYFADRLAHACAHARAVKKAYLRWGAVAGKVIRSWA